MPEQILLITFIIALIFSGGVAASYVFFDLLPAIQEAAGHVRFLLRGSLDVIPFSEVAIFGVAFTGFLSTMPLTGWDLSVFFPERQSEAVVLLAFIAGAVLFNVIKDEVPGAERGETKFFIVGALIYAAVLLLLLWMER